MHDIVFYEDRNGKSEVYDFLEELREKSKTNKDARIQFKQITLQIELLERYGTLQSTENVKQIDGDIWEIRPGNNRVFFFHFRNGRFVLLHHYRKKTQKTPKKEIIKAKVERDDYIKQVEDNKNENME